MNFADKIVILLGGKMDGQYVKFGEISILSPFDENEVLKPLWDKGFETCLVEVEADYQKYIIMTKIQ